jgi:hypothetical protein
MNATDFLAKTKDVKEYLTTNPATVIRYKDVWPLFGFTGENVPDKYEKAIITKAMSRNGYNVKHAGTDNISSDESYYYNRDTYVREPPRRPCDMTNEEVTSLVDLCFNKYDTYTINAVIAEGGFPEVFSGKCYKKDLTGRARIQYIVSRRSREIGSLKISQRAYAGKSYIARMNDK